MAVKKSARYTKIVVPLWGQAVHVVEAPTIAEATMEARRRWPSLDLTTAETERTDGICVQSPTDEPIILLPIGAKAGCVAHECLHATTALLKKVGVPVSVHDDEAAAYTTDDRGPRGAVADHEEARRSRGARRGTCEGGRACSEASGTCGRVAGAEPPLTRDLSIACFSVAHRRKPGIIRLSLT